MKTKKNLNQALSTGSIYVYICRFYIYIYIYIYVYIDNYDEVPFSTQNFKYKNRLHRYIYITDIYAQTHTRARAYVCAYTYIYI